MIEPIDRLFGCVAHKRADRPDELRLAVAALLIEVAGISGSFDDCLRKAVARLLASHFGLSPEAAAALLTAAEDAARRSTQMISFTETVVRHLVPEDRGQIIEILWQVSCTRGRPDAVQDALLRRVAALIGVADADRIQARRNALRYVEQGEPA